MKRGRSPIFRGRRADIRGRQNRLLLLEAAGFGFLVLVTWLDVEFFRLFFADPGGLFISLTETAWIVGLAGFVITLQVRSQNRIRILEGVLSTCSFCKRIDKGGKWVQIEQYVRDNSEATFSHGLCPECGLKHYGELYVRAMQGDGSHPDGGEQPPVLAGPEQGPAAGQG